MTNRGVLRCPIGGLIFVMRDINPSPVALRLELIVGSKGEET